MLTYSCTDEAFTLQNDAFTSDPTTLTINITLFDSTCTGTPTEYVLASGVGFTYTLATKSVSIPNDAMITGDGVYLFEYTYSAVDYSACTLVLCDGKCDVYNAIYDNIGACNCKDSDLDKAYNIFMHASIAQSLTECEDCCKAQEVYDNLLTLINGCTSC